jgi:hypothetical protein
MNKIIVVIFILFTIFCCSDERNVNNENADIIDMTSDIVSLNKDDIVEEIIYVPLKIVDDKFLIKYINSVFITDSLLFIVDLSLKAIFVYDLNGYPLYRIGNLGQGPGEYVNLRDVTLDRKEHKIIICDVTSQKIIYYDFSGCVLEEKRIPSTEHICYFSKDPKSDFFVGERRTLTKDLLVVFDKNKNIVDSHLRLDTKHTDVYKPYESNMYGTPFYIYNDTVFFLSIFDYSIYSYADGKFNREYSMDIPEKIKISSTTVDIKANKPSYEYISDYLEKGLLAQLSSLVVTDNYIFFKADGGRLPSRILYDRKNKKTYSYNNLFSDAKNILQQPICSEYNDWFVFGIYGQSFEYLRKNHGMKIDDEDNPVLCFVKLKKL